MKLYIALIFFFFLLLITSCNNKELDSNFNFNNDLYNYNYDQLYNIDAYEFLSSIEGDSIGYEFLKSHFEIVGLKVRAANKKNISVYFEIDTNNQNTIDINLYKNKVIRRISVYNNFKSSSIIIDYKYYL